MRQSALFRISSALLALWLAFALAEPVSLHHCPMHDPGAAWAGAADAASHGPAHGPDHSAPDDATGPHACSCIGHCGASTAVTLAKLRVGSFATLVAEGRRPTFLPRLFARQATSHVLPLPTAPPPVLAA